MIFRPGWLVPGLVPKSRLNHQEGLMLRRVFPWRAGVLTGSCFFCPVLFLTFTLGLAAQNTPLVYNRSITNAASYMPAGLPDGAIAQGSIFTFFGNRLGPSVGVSANAFPLGTTLGGTSINVIQGTTSVAAIPVYVSNGQINAIMPSNAPIGNASIQVVNGNGKGNLAPVRIVASAFGIFSALGSGQGPGILQNFISQTNQPINSPTIVAQPGQVITLWGTGLGPVTFPDNQAPQTGSLPVKTEVFVGGVSASIAYSGRTPCCSGTDQIVFTVPQNAPQGCWVPVYVRTAGTTISNFVTMAIGPNANSCSTDVLPQFTAGFITGKRVGKAVAVRTTTREDIGVATPVDVSSEYHVSFAFEPNPGPFPFNPAISFPPQGTCTAYTLYGDLLNAGPGPTLPDLAPSTIPLDWGGPLQLTGPSGSKSLTFSYSGARVGYLDGTISNNILLGTLFLNPGQYNLQGFGGMDIGAFTTNFTIPQPVVWTQQGTTTTVPRTQPLTLFWTGGDSGQVIAIIFFAIDLPSNSSYAAACLAPAGASSMTIPVDLLSNMPATRANPLHSKDVIYLIAMSGSSVQPINATGLDVGLTEFDSVIGKTVVLQ
jgi:uncharacterized protein (TIGR03437 family)